MSPHPHLKDLLEQAAETVPPADVPRDTWQRGRRRHRRSLALRAAAVVGVVALVAATPGLLDRATDRSAPQPAGSGASGPGLPDHLHAVPSHLAARGEDERWGHEEVSDDLAIGRAVAAWVTSAGLPVLVGATDGRYHLLDLPDFLLAGDLAISWFPGDQPPMALSPDGTRLAYAYAWPATDDGTVVPSGIRVLDLETGEVARDLALQGGSGVAVTQVSWSPDGAWLAWTGFETSYWTTTTLNGSRSRAGVAGPDGTRRAVEPGGSTYVDDDGAAIVLDGGSIEVQRSDGTTMARRGAAGTPELTGEGLLSPDGSRLVIGTAAGYDLVAIDLDRDRVETRSGGAQDWSARPLAWVGDAVLVQRTPPASGDEGLLSLVDVTGDAAVRDVGVLDGGESDNPHTGVGPLSVAADLVTEDQPTVTRPAPDWPWDPPSWAVPAALGAALLLVAALVRVVVRRRRRRAREELADE
ncbi:hypothetical protein NOK12_09680 [Nocardioides sp. OK12]|uniref:hypothetical protein n=1 Tax=Nocardioides sp. OK12 TaxID=2758661 RepID=UPI0021C27C3C|nr:hypothetical protein [Nocardioides sp. OK12]GHJ58449.1 hypothetical protein NOK12_09680 [Nocardioides sp. OK12]